MSDIDEIKRDIEDTRRRISTEIEALEDKLTPSHAKEVIKERIVQTKDRITEKMQDSVTSMRDDVAHLGTDVVSTARANPIPLALIGVGTGWLVWEMVRSRRTIGIEAPFELPSGTFEGGYESYGEIRTDDVALSAGTASASHGLDAVKERANETFRAAKGRAGSIASSARSAAGTARERASHLASDARDRASHLAESTRDRASVIAARGKDGVQRAGSFVDESYRASPLVYGALAALAGVGIAMMLPHTEREDAMLGEARQKVLTRAREIADEARQVAIDAVSKGASAAKEAARKEIDQGRMLHR